MSTHQLPIFAVVALRRNNEVLLLKRGPNATFAPGQYCIVGGAVEKNETFRQAIIREAYEEVGITINPENLKFAHMFHKQHNGFELLVSIFECSSWDGEITNKEPAKHTDACWFSLDNLPENMVIAHRNALIHMKNNVPYSEQT